MKTATRPDFYSHFETLKAKQKKAKGITDEEQAYAFMANTKGWLQFKVEANRLIDELDNLTEVAIAKGLPLEEIGRNTIISSLAKGLIKRLINIAEDSKEAVEQPGEPK